MAESFNKSSRIVLLPGLPGMLLPLSEQEKWSLESTAKVLNSRTDCHSCHLRHWSPTIPAGPTSGPLPSLRWTLECFWGKPGFQDCASEQWAAGRWALVDSVSCKGLKDWAILQLETWQPGILGSPNGAGQKGTLQSWIGCGMLISYIHHNHVYHAFQGRLGPFLGNFAHALKPTSHITANTPYILNNGLFVF